MIGERGDRFVIDDPHLTSTPEQIERARQAFMAALPDLLRDNPGAVVIMSKLHR